MTLLRFAGRALFSSFFVTDGVQMAAQPDHFAAEVGRTVDTVVPAARKLLPEGVAEKLPEDARSWVRILGGVEVAAGVAYAFGFLRRPAAVLLTLATIPHVVGSLPSRSIPAEHRLRSYGNLTRNLALLGASIIASQDTEGHPSLAWRANYGVAQLGTTADRSRDQLALHGKLAKAQVQRGIDRAHLAAVRGLAETKDALS